MIGYIKSDRSFIPGKMRWPIREILKDDQFSGVEFVKTFFNLSSLSKDQNFVISVAKLSAKEKVSCSYYKNRLY